MPTHNDPWWVTIPRPTKETLIIQGFTEKEVDALVLVKESFKGGDKYDGLEREVRRRLEFMRWLVETGRITGDTDIPDKVLVGLD